MRLTLLQMMKVVVACAFASAYCVPFVRLAEVGLADWQTMLIVIAIGIPLIFVLSTIVLARKGTLKDWMIRVLSMTSVVIALGVCLHWWVSTVFAWIRHGMLISSIYPPWRASVSPCSYSDSSSSTSSSRSPRHGPKKVGLLALAGMAKSSSLLLIRNDSGGITAKQTDSLKALTITIIYTTIQSPQTTKPPDQQTLMCRLFHTNGVV